MFLDQTQEDGRSSVGWDVYRDQPQHRPVLAQMLKPIHEANQKYLHNTQVCIEGLKSSRSPPPQLHTYVTSVHNVCISLPSWLHPFSCIHRSVPVSRSLVYLFVADKLQLFEIKLCIG